MQVARETVQHHPANVAALYCLAVVEGRLGQKRKAISCLRTAIEIDPTNPALYLALLEYQQQALDWRGIVQTITEMNKLPEFKEMNSYHARVSRTWDRLMLSLGIVTGAVIVLLWLRHRKTRP